MPLRRHASHVSFPRPSTLRAFAAGSTLILGASLAGFGPLPHVSADAVAHTSAPATSSDGSLVTRIPTLNVPGDTTSGEDPNGGTWDVGVTLGGDYAYATSASDNRVFVFDLEQELHVATMTLGTAGKKGAKAPIFIAKSADIGAVLGGEPTSPNVFILDTAQHRLTRTFVQQAEFGYIGAIAPSGNYFYYASPTWGEIRKLNTETGLVDSKTLYNKVVDVSALSVSANGETLLVSQDKLSGSKLTSLRTHDLSGAPPITLTSDGYTQIVRSLDDTRTYGTTTGGDIIKFDRATGTVLASPDVNPHFDDLVADPSRDAAWAVSGNAARIVAADFGINALIGTPRSVEGAPRAIAQQTTRHTDLPGALVVSTGKSSVSGISLIRAPKVASHPADASVTKTGDKAQFHAQIDGVNPEYVSWQESSNGSAWVALPTSSGTTLEIPATRETVLKQYRAIYSDPFWGANGITNAARIHAQQPRIAKPIAALEGTVGQPITKITPKASAQLGHSWSAQGLPLGINLDTATGVISGTPTAVSNSPILLTVIDEFGTDTLEIPVRLLAAPHPGDRQTNNQAKPHSEERKHHTPQSTLAQAGTGGLLITAVAAVVVLAAGSSFLVKRRRLGQSRRGQS